MTVLVARQVTATPAPHTLGTLPGQPVGPASRAARETLVPEPVGTPAVDPEAAAEFLTQFYAETSARQPFNARLREVRRGDRRHRRLLATPPRS